MADQTEVRLVNIRQSSGWETGSSFCSRGPSCGWASGLWAITPGQTRRIAATIRMERYIPEILDLRTRTGRPHCLVVDEAHHMLHESRGTTNDGLPQLIDGTILITVHPDSLALTALANLDMVVAVGKEPEKTLSAAGMQSVAESSNFPGDRKQGEATIWFRHSDRKPSVRARTDQQAPFEASG